MKNHTSVNLHTPFGTILDGRTFGNLGRIGFGGHEKDDETIGTNGNTYDYGSRVYNPSLARFLSTDILQSKYPGLSPYNYVANNPIIFIDNDGNELRIYGDATTIKNKLQSDLGPNVQVTMEKITVKSSVENGVSTVGQSYYVMHVTPIATDEFIDEKRLPENYSKLKKITESKEVYSLGTEGSTFLNAMFGDKTEDPDVVDYDFNIITKRSKDLKTGNLKVLETQDISFINIKDISVIDASDQKLTAVDIIYNAINAQTQKPNLDLKSSKSGNTITHVTGREKFFNNFFKSLVKIEFTNTKENKSFETTLKKPTNENSDAAVSTKEVD